MLKLMKKSTDDPRCYMDKGERHTVLGTDQTLSNACCRCVRRTHIYQLKSSCRTDEKSFQKAKKVRSIGQGQSDWRARKKSAGVSGMKIEFSWEDSPAWGQTASAGFAVDSYVVGCG